MLDISNNVYDCEVYETSISNFNEYANLHKQIIASLASRNYKIPRLVQNPAYEYIYKGRDTLIISPTGTGKTFAYAIPIVNRLLDILQASMNENKSIEMIEKFNNKIYTHKVKCVIIVPTNELCEQTYKMLEILLTSNNEIVPFIIKETISNIKSINEKITGNLLITQPVTLLSIINICTNFMDGNKLHDKNLNNTVFPNVEIVVIDEADLLLSVYGYENETKQIFQQCESTIYSTFNFSYIPRKVQFILITATINEDIKLLSNLTLYKAVCIYAYYEQTNSSKVEKYLNSIAEHISTFVKVSIPPNSQKLVEHQFINLNSNDNDDIVIIYGIVKNNLYRSNFDHNKVLIFTNTLFQLARIYLALKNLKVNCQYLCSKLKSDKCIQTINDFNTGKCNVLIATDDYKTNDLDNVNQYNSKLKKRKITNSNTFSRGIDYKNISCLILHALPCSVNDYIHKVGRIGRDLSTKSIPVCLVFVDTKDTKYNVWDEIRQLYNFSSADDINLQKFEKYIYRINDSMNKVTKNAIRKFMSG